MLKLQPKYIIAIVIVIVLVLILIIGLSVHFAMKDKSDSGTGTGTGGTGTGGTGTGGTGTGTGGSGTGGTGTGSTGGTGTGGTGTGTGGTGTGGATVEFLESSTFPLMESSEVFANGSQIGTVYDNVRINRIDANTITVQFSNIWPSAIVFKKIKQGVYTGTYLDGTPLIIADVSLLNSSVPRSADGKIVYTSALSDNVNPDNGIITPIGGIVAVLRIKKTAA
jgi:hypothetical protein